MKRSDVVRTRSIGLSRPRSTRGAALQAIAGVGALALAACGGGAVSPPGADGGMIVVVGSDMSVVPQ